MSKIHRRLRAAWNGWRTNLRAQAVSIGPQPTSHAASPVPTAALDEAVAGRAPVILSNASAQDTALSSAAEWLLDNYYLVVQALRQIEEDLPESYYRQLPKLAV